MPQFEHFYLTLKVRYFIEVVFKELVGSVPDSLKLRSKMRDDLLSEQFHFSLADVLVLVQLIDEHLYFGLEVCNPLTQIASIVCH